MPELNVFGVHNFAPYLKQHRVSRLLIVPTLLNALANGDAGGDFDFKQIRQMTVTGEPVKRDLCLKVAKKCLGGKGITNFDAMYGSSEAAFSHVQQLRLEDLIRDNEDPPLGVPLSEEVKTFIIKGTDSESISASGGAAVDLASIP